MIQRNPDIFAWWKVIIRFFFKLRMAAYYAALRRGIYRSETTRNRMPSALAG